MAYKHILVAVDLSPESQLLVSRAVSLAKPYDAKVSLIHVELNQTGLYTGLIEAELGYTQERISYEMFQGLKALASGAGYPINETLNGRGDLAQVLGDAVKKYQADVVVCGHHHDFWSRLMSSARQLINTVHVDLLIVPLYEPDDDDD